MKDKVEGTVAEENAKVETTESTKPDNNDENNCNGDTKSESETSPAKDDVMSLLAQGKRHLFVKDFPSAVAVLGDACAKLGEVFGELGDECADGYFCYGRALLELSREESNVLVENEGDGDEKNEGEDEKDENEGEDDDNEEGSEENNKEQGTEETVSEKQEEDGVANEGEKTNDTENGVGEKPKEDNTTDGDEKADEVQEEDVNNLQLAWEVFELAKIIFHRQNNDAKLAETYLYLGEVSLESENYSVAIDDMKKCLDIQKKILAEDHRDIAETLFQLGVACSFQHMFEESKSFFKQASDVLETRIKNLQSGCLPNDANTKNPFYSVDKEIEEIKSILPEIKEKIDDVDDLKNETLKSMLKLAAQGSSSVDDAGPSSSQNGNTDKPATNISHLIRKKRTAEEEPAPNPEKKPCNEE